MESSRSAGDLFAVILNHVTDGVTAQDKSGKLIYANPVAAHIIGYPSPEALLAAPLSEVMQQFEVTDEHGHPFPLTQLPGRLALEGNEPSPVTLHFRLKATGAEQWSQVHAKPVVNAQGEVEFVVNTFHLVTAQKQIEAALKQAQAQRKQFQVTLSSIGDAVMATDTTGAVTFMNAVAETLTGWTQEDADGLHLDTVFSIVNEETRATVESPVTKVLREGGVVGLANHTVLLAKDGREIPIDDSGAPIRDDEGTLTGVVLTFRDITERKEAENRARSLYQLTAALSQALQPTAVAEVILRHVRVAMGASLGAVGVLTHDGQTLEFLSRDRVPNAVQQRLPRLSLDYSVPMTDAIRTGEVVWVASLEEYRQRYPHLIEQAQVYTGSQAIVGIPLRLEDRIIGSLGLSFREPQPYREEEVTFLLTLAHQCVQALERARLYSEEQQARRALQGRIHQQSLIAQLGVRALHTDVDTLLNEAAVVVAQGLEVEYVKVLELLPGEQQLLLRAGVGWQEGLVGRATESAGVQSQAGYALLAQQPVIVEDLRTETRFSSPWLLHAHGVISGMSVIIEYRERAFGVLGAHTQQRRQFTHDDIHFLQAIANILGAAIEREQSYRAERVARLEAEKANRLKIQFLGMISHELRTPLTSIKGFASTLLAEDVVYHQEDARRFISVINSEADNLSELVEQLLDVSSLQAGNLRINPRRQALETILRGAQVQLERVARAHPLAIHLPPVLPQVTVDEQRIVQVLSNLVQNAAKFSPAGSEITVAVATRDNQVQLDVIDHGSGIPVSEREVVFEAFRQLERRGKAGAGLGLAICKGLVEAHGGTIWIQDTPGGGTTVSFTLPVVEG
jgi:PAS domain S-box-containing protein